MIVSRTVLRFSNGPTSSLGSAIVVTIFYKHVTQSCTIYIYYVDEPLALSVAEVEYTSVKGDNLGRLHAFPFRIDVVYIVHAFMHQ